MALQRRGPTGEMLHHSDQGSTDANANYQAALDARQITGSMSRRGNCYDTAAMERWGSTLKAELGERFETNAAAKEQLFDHIEVLLPRRLVGSYLGKRVHHAGSGPKKISESRVEVRSTSGTRVLQFKTLSAGRTRCCASVAGFADR